MKEVFKNYLQYKYITIANIILCVILGIFANILIKNNVKLRSEAYIFIFDINNDYQIPPEISIDSDFLLERGNIESTFISRIQSYKNLLEWTKINELDIESINMNLFLSLELDKAGKIFVSDANDYIIEENDILLISDYLNFTLKKNNFILSSKLLNLISYNNKSQACESMGTFIKFGYLNQHENFLEYYYENCIKKFADQGFFNKQIDIYELSQNFEKYYKSDLSPFKIYDFVSLSNKKKQTIYFNNLRVVNLYTVIATILFISLIIQNLIIVLLNNRD